MTRLLRFLNRRHAAVLAVIPFLFTGCIQPQVAVKPDAKLAAYRKVYLVPCDPDPRSVTPRVLSRLKQTGFDAVELKPDGPPVDLQGSGFLVTPQGHVLTCAHVVGRSTNATVWIDGSRLTCRVLSTDTNKDLALLLVNGTNSDFRPLPFAAETNYNMGQDVFTMGFPLANVLGTAPRLNEGLISATVGMDDDPKQVQVSAAVQPGNSGGPLLNARGEVIGVINATLNPMRVMLQSGGGLPQNVNFAIKVGPIHDFLAAAHVSLPAAAPDAKAGEGFQEASKSLALVRPGNVTDEELKQPALVCAFTYFTIFDYWARFRRFEIVFFDIKKGEWVFKAGQFQEDPFSTEDGTLNNVFAQISEKFFPDGPNPFKGAKKK